MTPVDLRSRPRAVLFDMDGTITEPLLDFALIKREMGLGDGPILESLAMLAPDERARAEQVLHRHEDHAARNSTLNRGCKDLLAWLAESSVPTALITRNTRRSVQTVLALHGLSFGCLITREDGTFKPSPEPLHRACRMLGVAESEAWMVGDSIHDVLAGHAAGVRTVWVSHGKEHDYDPPPWRTVRDLCALAELLETCRQGA